MLEKEVRKTFYDKDFIPNSLDELYQSGWKEYMLYHIRKYTLSDVTHAPEDLLQDMMVQMAGNGFLDKYDPEKADFTAYLHTFIRNFMSKVYNKEHKTKNGEKIINAAAIVGSVEEAENLEGHVVGHVVSNEMIADVSGSFEDLICLTQSIEADLEAIKTDSVVDYNGKIVSRDPLTVYEMLKDGYEIKEIAQIFGTSKQFVYSLRKKIMNIIGSYA